MSEASADSKRTEPNSPPFRQSLSNTRTVEQANSLIISTLQHSLEPPISPSWSIPSTFEDAFHAMGILGGLVLMTSGFASSLYLGLLGLFLALAAVALLNYTETDKNTLLVTNETNGDRNHLITALPLPNQLQPIPSFSAKAPEVSATNPDPASQWNSVNSI